MWIFLTLRFYMKSMLVILKLQKEQLNFKFLGIFDIFKCEIHKKSNQKPLKMLKMAVFDTLKSAKMLNQNSREIAKYPNSVSET